ncbi:MAG: hypothetical protein DYG96_12265 [Chlorobi bacterium CHB2]|nr:hypothetical protein [Chlorobi bacterium CHB2]
MTTPFLPPLLFFMPPSLLLRGVRGVVVAAVVAVLLAFPGMALGQERSVLDDGPTRVGVIGELGVGVSQGSIPVYAGTPDCGLFESGTANRGGLMAAVQIPDLFGQRWGLSLMVGWQSGASTLETPPNDPTVIFDSATVAPVTLERALRLDRSDQRALVRASAEYQVGPQFTVGIGGTVSYRLRSAITQTDNVSGPGDHSFQDGLRSRTMNDGERLSGAGISLALSPSADYTFPLGPQVSGLVGIAGEVDLLSMVERLAWRDLTVQGRLGLMIHLGGMDTAASLPSALPDPIAVRQRVDTPASSRVQSPPLSSSALVDSGAQSGSHGSAQPLVAHLQLHAVDAAGEATPVAAVGVDHVRLQRRWELRTGSSGVAIDGKLLQQQHRLPPAAAANFTPDLLAEVPTSEWQRHLLNVVGFRMVHHHPNAKVRLRGGGQLVGEIQEYLHSAWGIEAARMEQEPAKPFHGGATERGDRDARVTLLADTVALLDPVVISAESTTVDPPRIQLAPAFQSGAGIQEWKIRIAHNGQPVGEYSSQATLGGTAQINWRIAADGASGKMTTLLAELQVRDSSGASTTAAAQLPLQVVRTERITEQTLNPSGSVIQGRWSLPRSMAANHDNQPRTSRVLEEVAAAAGSGSRIEVMLADGEPATKDWGKEVATTLREKCAQAGKHCTISIGTAPAIPTNSMEIRVGGQ